MAAQGECLGSGAGVEDACQCERAAARGVDGRASGGARHRDGARGDFAGPDVKQRAAVGRAPQQQRAATHVGPEVARRGASRADRAHDQSACVERGIAGVSICPAQNQITRTRLRERRNPPRTAAEHAADRGKVHPGVHVVVHLNGAGAGAEVDVALEIDVARSIRSVEDERAARKSAGTHGEYAAEIDVQMRRRGREPAAARSELDLSRARPERPRKRAVALENAAVEGQITSRRQPDAVLRLEDTGGNNGRAAVGVLTGEQPLTSARFVHGQRGSAVVHELEGDFVIARRVSRKG